MQQSTSVAAACASGHYFAGYPLDLVGYLVKSEYATLKFLGYTSVQTPQVYAYGVAGHDHGVGVSFVLMEELIGKPWIRQTATAEEISKVWRNLANFMVEIEKYPLELAGSLIIHRDNFQLSAVASDRSLGSIPQLVPEEDTPEQFFLKHVDAKGDHLLVDPELNITGIIDWQMAKFVPRREAFRPSLITVDMPRSCHGQVSLSADGHLLANAMRESGISEKSCRLVAVDEKVRRFFWGLAHEPN
ncbi:Aminoglycoside phosphotransferase [Akanthomyces lecanii RCEF 1005]|uniref:Aminoglycoside phosphotransferase n=1 Tax=Akanthomyces lecanii RCEF 1005 TaxID=1081108 RepID=A0A168HEH8_CORDF|nr:Aminoglycoside phosphotransferase [Akanthomyces lecanii RCEF 1005]